MSQNVILPPYRITRQLCILRKTLTINFSQENMRYLTEKLYHWKVLLNMNPMVQFLYNIFYILLTKIKGQSLSRNA
jgi:hypothetical protein